MSNPNNFVGAGGDKTSFDLANDLGWGQVGGEQSTQTPGPTLIEPTPVETAPIVEPTPVEPTPAPVESTPEPAPIVEPTPVAPTPVETAPIVEPTPVETAPKPASIWDEVDQAPAAQTTQPQPKIETSGDFDFHIDQATPENKTPDTESDAGFSSFSSNESEEESSYSVEEMKKVIEAVVPESKKQAFREWADNQATEDDLFSLSLNAKTLGRDGWDIESLKEFITGDFNRSDIDNEEERKALNQHDLDLVNKFFVDDKKEEPDTPKTEKEEDKNPFDAIITNNNTVNTPKTPEKKGENIDEVNEKRGEKSEKDTFIHQAYEKFKSLPIGAKIGIGALAGTAVGGLIAFLTGQHKKEVVVPEEPDEVIEEQVNQDQSDIEIEEKAELEWGTGYESLDEQLENIDFNHAENTGCYLNDAEQKTSPNALGSSMKIYQKMAKDLAERARDNGEYAKYQEYNNFYNKISEVFSKGTRITEAEFQELFAQVPEEWDRDMVLFQGLSQGASSAYIFMGAAEAGIEGFEEFADCHTAQDAIDKIQEIVDNGGAEELAKKLKDLLYEHAEFGREFGSGYASHSYLVQDADGKLLSETSNFNDAKTYIITITFTNPTTGKTVTIKKKAICTNDYCEITTETETKIVPPGPDTPPPPPPPHDDLGKPIAVYERIDNKIHNDIAQDIGTGEVTVDRTEDVTKVEEQTEKPSSDEYVTPPSSPQNEDSKKGVDDKPKEEENRTDQERGGEDNSKGEEEQKKADERKDEEVKPGTPEFDEAMKDLGL